ncbi:MAG: copper chaperone PCu(A)C [Gammaproteobacteria bacterium]|nr:copper chaperone PCu(A)C [Gammaproteobacteria bacterium]
MKKIIFLAFLLASSSAWSQNNQVQFINGWIKQLPPVVPVRAGYLKINNTSKQDREIIAVQSNAFEQVEMHESKMDDGMMKMIELESIHLPAKSQVELKPGGKHLMLIAPLQPLQIDDNIEIIVTFADESTQSVILKIKK